METIPQREIRQLCLQPQRQLETQPRSSDSRSLVFSHLYKLNFTVGGFDKAAAWMGVREKEKTHGIIA